MVKQGTKKLSYSQHRQWTVNKNKQSASYISKHRHQHKLRPRPPRLSDHRHAKLLNTTTNGNHVKRVDSQWVTTKSTDAETTNLRNKGSEEQFVTPPATPTRLNLHLCIKTSDKFYTPPTTPYRSKGMATQDSPIKATQINQQSNKPKEASMMETDIDEINNTTLVEKESENFEMRTMHRGFKRLEEKVEEMTKKLEAEIQKKPECASSEEQAQVNKKVSEMEKDIGYGQVKFKMISGTIQHMYQMIQDLTKKVESLEIAGTRRQILITGLKLESDKKQDRILQVEAFMRNEVQVYVEIEDVYTLGQSDTPSIVVTLKNLRDKHEVLQNKSNLKGLTNHKNNSIYVNDYFPQATNEKKRRERELIKWNKQLGEEQKVVEFKKGKLNIDGEEYIKAVNEPQPDEILDLTIEEYERITKLPISTPVKLTEKDSIFIAYTAAAQTHHEIKQLYDQNEDCAFKGETYCVHLQHQWRKVPNKL